MRYHSYGFLVLVLFSLVVFSCMRWLMRLVNDYFESIFSESPLRFTLLCVLHCWLCCFTLLHSRVACGGMVHHIPDIASSEALTVASCLNLCKQMLSDFQFMFHLSIHPKMMLGILLTMPRFVHQNLIRTRTM